MRLWPSSMTVSMASSIRGVGRQGDDGDARDHDLVDALVAELDDRVDHLLLLGLEDALLAALLDDEPELLGADPLLGGTSAPNRRLIAPGHARQERDERAEAPGRGRRSRARTAERDALGVGEPDLLGHELAEDDREDGQDAGHDEQGDDPGVRRAGAAMPSSDGLEPDAQADGREGRGEEADERDAELDDREEPARVLLAAAGPAARRVCPRRRAGRAGSAER